MSKRNKTKKTRRDLGGTLDDGFSSMSLGESRPDDESDDVVSVKAPFPVAMWDFKHCDPKRCTGKKLERMKLIRTLKIKQKFHGIALTPMGQKCVSQADRDIVERCDNNDFYSMS